LGYDIGKGYVNCQDDVYMSVNDTIEDDYQAEKIKNLLKDAKTRMMHELGKTLTFSTMQSVLTQVILFKLFVAS
jgi:hypothetical protein